MTAGGPHQQGAQAGTAQERARRDALLVLTLAPLLLLAASTFEWGEAVAHWTGRHESVQADELLLALFALAVAAVWYAWRRRHELESELAARRAAEARATELLERNQALSRELIEVQERERRALARELHDEMGQRCNAIRVEAALIGRAASDADTVQAGARRIAQMADDLYALVRGMLRRLRPVDLDELGLAAAAESLCEDWQARSAIACALQAEGDLDDLGEATNIALYRSIQESLNNVLNHAGASRVRVHLERSLDRVVLTVEDDGRGFDPQHVAGGLGLVGMGERATALAGEFRIDSRPGAGARIEVRLPTPIVGPA